MTVAVVGIAWLLAYVVVVVGLLRDRLAGARTRDGALAAVLGAAGVTAGWLGAAGAAGSVRFLALVGVVAGALLVLWGVIHGLGRARVPGGESDATDATAAAARHGAADALTGAGLDRRIAAALEAHERAAGYGVAELALDSDGGDVYVVSDLHIASGRARDGSYVGTENFFADESFDRLLTHLRSSAHGASEGPGAPPTGANRPATLIMNGDFVDFIRVMEVPRSDDDFERWSALLSPLGIHRSPEQLARVVSDNERRNGLRTTDYKCVWKLAVAMRGHETVFDGLAAWVRAGHRLVVVKGNHDVEWYWPAVRNYLRLVLACRSGGDPLAELARILPLVSFADHAVVIDRATYVEHGHQYEPLTSVVGAPLLEGTPELRLPFGSFFNRYIINHIELGYPYIDNIRPRENILPVLIRERFPTALRLLAHHVPLMLKTIPRGYYRYHLMRVLPFVLAIGIPVAAAAWAFRVPIGEAVALVQNPGGPGGLLGAVFGVVVDSVRSLAWLVLSYVGSQVLAVFQLAGGHGLEPHARELFARRPQLRHVVFGHTHDPRQSERHGRWFYNCGTWVPVIETSSADVRHDRTYTYVHLPPDAAGSGRGQVFRWNDDAGRCEPAIIMHRA
jgi:UDP-2,3-diacylglucosamine pyrophosphatase LpxH